MRIKSQFLKKVIKTFHGNEIEAKHRLNKNYIFQHNSLLQHLSSVFLITLEIKVSSILIAAIVL